MFLRLFPPQSGVSNVPAPRSAGLTAAFLAMASLVLLCAPHAFISPGIAAQRSALDPVDVLHKQATKARADLEKATQQSVSRRRQLAQSRQKLQATLAELGKADAQLEQMRGPLVRLANAAYQQKGAAGSMVVFGRVSPETGLRAAADVSHIAAAQEALIRQVTSVRQRREELTSTAQDLQSRNAVEQARLQRSVDALRRRSAELTRQLNQMLDRMQAGEERRLSLGCDPALVTNARKFPNGLIPSRYLCRLPQPGRKLRADAALTFYKLNAAYKRRFGGNMCLTDSYRSLSDQHRLYASRPPGYAAVPGSSNHGFGTAVDICGGVQNQGSSQFNWLRANSLKYGWFHPAWAYSSPFEPWHWEYKAPTG
ncbi:MAG: peptidase and DD-carboxypeptidase VanY/endolysin [Streptosporangiaceae bacterium]|jgi:D-alanyl-D-alanine carboxypeptidase|nr:peptidase and DD-carboxypeptidase VanY/endolysin [Streptosporangiaceae bacterium]